MGYLRTCGYIYCAHSYLTVIAIVVQQTYKTDKGFEGKETAAIFSAFQWKGNPTSHKSGRKSLWHDNGNKQQ